MAGIVSSISLLAYCDKNKDIIKTLVKTSSAVLEVKVEAGHYFGIFGSMGSSGLIYVDSWGFDYLRIKVDAVSDFIKLLATTTYSTNVITGVR